MRQILNIINCEETHWENVGNSPGGVKEKSSKCAEVKEYFDRKFVKKRQQHNFVVGDIVLMNVKKRIKDIKNVGVQWIGPCTVVYKRPGQFYDIEYKCEESTIKYLRVHPKFFKLYVGKVM